MTDYTDVPAVNALHYESQQVAQALANLEAGGTVSMMMIMPPPPGVPEPGQPMPPMMMSVQVQVPSATPNLIAQVQAWLEQRLIDIGAELTALGVTVPPPADMLTRNVPGQPPMMPPMTQP